jgi:two-component system nitrogen regulation response regulator GlnG
MVGEGTFRGDLFYRLNVFTIRLPALRERRDDIPLLARHFLQRFAKDLNSSVQTISDSAMQLLTAYPWPGNVREFQSVIKQALLQATGPVLLPEFLPDAVRNKLSAASQSPTAGMDLSALTAFIQERLRAETTALYSEFQSITDRHLLKLVLEHAAGNLSKAARILGITRATLRTKLQALGLSADPAPNGDAAP